MKYSIVHIYLYGLLKREVQGGNLIHISKIHPIVKFHIRIPHKYQIDIIKEMIDNGFLKKLDRDNYEIVTCKIKRPLVDSLGEPLW